MATGLERPRTLKATLGHVVGLLLIAGIGDALLLPMLTLPVILVSILSGLTGAAVLTPLFGVYVALLVGSTRPYLEYLYTASDTSATTDGDELVAKAALQLFLYAVYFNVVLAVSVVTYTLLPAGVATAAVAVPLLDRGALLTVGNSPVVLLLQATAVVVVTLGVVEEIDLSVLRHGAFVPLR